MTRAVMTMRNAGSGRTAMAEQDLVLVAIESGIARITLNRPDRLNALDQDLAMALARKACSGVRATAKTAGTPKTAWR